MLHLSNFGTTINLTYGGYFHLFLSGIIMLHLADLFLSLTGKYLSPTDTERHKCTHYGRRIQILQSQITQTCQNFWFHWMGTHIAIVVLVKECEDLKEELGLVVSEITFPQCLNK